MIIGKDAITQALRDEILADADFLIETARADSLKITLSFQSRMKPERHVWIDTQMGEDGHGFTVDLEDWTYEESWDNAVATVDTVDAQIARDVIHAWLRGEPLDECLRRCFGCRIERKQMKPV
jgi:hypothetical protein